jgi:hypothetical protein
MGLFFLFNFFIQQKYKIILNYFLKSKRNKKILEKI